MIITLSILITIIYLNYKMAKPILFGDDYFKGKNAVTKEIRDRISKYEAEENLNKEDEFFLLDYLNYIVNMKKK